MATGTDGNGPAWQPKAQAMLARLAGLLLGLLGAAVILHALRPPARAAPIALPGGFTIDAVPVLVAVTLAMAAAVGAVASRIRWVSYFAFKRKNFDPLAIPFHIAVLLEAPLIALVLLGLGAVAGFEAQVNAPTLALMFTLGYFAEETWDIFHGRFRALLGKDPHGLSMQSWVDGVDVPVEMLVPALELGERTAESVREALRTAGVGYSHELLAWKRNGRLSELAKRTKLPEADLERLVLAAEAVRRGEAFERAVERVVRKAVPPTVR